MNDPMFGGTVIYLCEHNAEGALGMIVNKPTEIMLDELLERIDLEPGTNADWTDIGNRQVMFGGPVQAERGFVLHGPFGDFSSTLKVTGQVELTNSRDILEAVAQGKGPERFLVTLGCSSWSAGQLEQEITNNGWLTVRSDPGIIFDLPIEQRLAAAMRLLGFDPMMLAGEAGHA